jgi:ubiquinone/menaquinone biosynthesis C-methylase UbiE
MKRIFKKLRPYLFGGRQIAWRDGLVLDFIARQAKGSRLLDAGAGPQRFKPYCQHLQYTSQDFGEYTGGDDFAGERLANWHSKSCDLICDISAIPLDSGSIDAIICVEVFEHLPKPIDAIKEFARLLKSGGRILITAPFNSQYHQIPFFYYSGFSSEFYKLNATENGLDVVAITPIGDYYENSAQELLRLPFLKSGLLLRVLSIPMILTAYLYVFLLHLLNVPSPVSPLGYVVELKKP